MVRELGNGRKAGGKELRGDDARTVPARVRVPVDC